MALTTDLQRIANLSSGSYLLEYDNSQIPQSVISLGLRLVIGQSRIGTVNKPMYIETATQFEAIFGKIDRYLERRGSYFHRQAAFMLQAGPIIALNIRKFDDELDLSGILDISSMTQNNNGTVETLPYRDVFDTNRFWKIDTDNIIDDTNTDKLFTIVNVGSNKKSFFIRRHPNAGYDALVSDYFEQLGRDVPAYLDPQSNINDTFVEVYVFDNDFSDILANQQNASYGYLFNSNGLQTTVTDALGNEVDGLYKLSTISEAKFAKLYEGSLINDLVSLSGNTTSIVEVINEDVDNTGLIAALNINILDSAEMWESGETVVSDGMKKVLPIDLIGSSIFHTDASGDFDLAQYDNKLVKFCSYEYYAKMFNMDCSKYELADIPTGTTGIKYSDIGFNYNVVDNGDTTYTLSPSETNSFYYWGANIHKVGETFVNEVGNAATLTNIQYKGIRNMLIGLHTSKLPLQSSGEIFPVDETTGLYVYPVGDTNAGEPLEYDAITDAPLDGIGGVVIAMPTLTTLQMETLLSEYGVDRNVMYLTFDNALLIGGTKTVTQDNELPTTFTFTDGSTLDYFTTDTINVIYSKEPDDIISEYKSFTLSNYKIRNDQFVNNTAARQNEIINAFISDLQRPLIDKDLITFDYIIDTFKTFIEPNIKQQFTALAETRQMCTYLGSMPSLKAFAKSKDPYFKDTVSGKFKTSYIAKGGNTGLPYTTVFSLPSSGNTYGAFFGPDIIVDDFGVDLNIPIAPIISNSFVRKVNRGNRFDIVAGSDTGLLFVSGIKGLEEYLDKEDRNSLEPFGYNPVIRKKTGLQIYGNNTAQNNIKSALTYLHVRELLNHIERQVLVVLEQYEWKFNTPQNRLEIVTQADSICQNTMSNGGLRYYKNTMDGDNNTNEIIENTIGVLDTIIVPGIGMQRLVHRMTINSAERTVSIEII